MGKRTYGWPKEDEHGAVSCTYTSLLLRFIIIIYLHSNATEKPQIMMWTLLSRVIARHKNSVPDLGSEKSKKMG